MAKKRKLVAKGIYRDRSGVAIIVSVRGTPREFRANEQGRKYATFTKPDLIIERKRIDAREHLKEERVTATADTFRADVQQFLNTLSGGHKVNTTGYMAHWEQHFAGHPRNAITELEVQTAFAAINKGASTKRHIRRALVGFYDTLNGVSGYNPARVLKPPPKPPEEARAIPFLLIERIFAALQPSRARARLMVLAYVGLPQKQIAQLQPADVRLKDRVVIVRPRRKGAGAGGRALPLSDAGIAALTEFVAQNAFGTFQNSQLVRTFKLGATRAGVQLADDARPYDLRHSFLTELDRSGADIRDIAYFGMHATIEQASRYIKSGASERATNVIRAVPRFLTMATPPKGSKASKVRTSTAQARTRKQAHSVGHKPHPSRGKL